MWWKVPTAVTRTLELAADGRSVAKWRSVAGDGQSYRPLAGSPTRVADALNGLPVVDCGTLNGADKASLRLYTPAGEPVEHNNDGAQNFIPGAPRYKSVFIVYGSQVFNMDLVMASVLALGAAAVGMYLLVLRAEKFLNSVWGVRV